MIEAVAQGAEHLSEFPAMGRAGRVGGTRELIIAPYVVVYRILDDAVVRIDAVILGAKRF